MHGFDFGKVIIYTNDVGLIKSSTSEKLYYFQTSAIVMPKEDKKDSYMNHWLFKKPVFMHEDELFEYDENAAVRILFTSSWFMFDDDYDSATTNLIQRKISDAAQYFGRHKILWYNYKEDLMLIMPNVFINKDAPISDYYFSFDREKYHDAFKVKNIWLLLFERNASKFYPSFDSLEWKKLLEQCHCYTFSDYRKYRCQSIYGRHNHYIGIARNGDMFDAMIVKFNYCSLFNENEVFKMLNNLQSSRQYGSYEIGLGYKEYGASFNDYSSDKLRDICLQLIKDRKAITDKIQAGTILPHRACYEMIMLYRQFIADYENEAVDILTYCIRRVARNYDEV